MSAGEACCGLLVRARPKREADVPRTPLGGDPHLRRTVTFEADRLLRREAADQGERFRAVRLRHGLTQADVARAVGVTRSVITELEQGNVGVSLQVRARAAVLLGCRLRLPLYADGRVLLHDAVHSRIVERLLGRCHPRWASTVEAPVPGPGHRSTDLRLVDGRDVVLAEVETAVRRWEEIARELHDKREAISQSLGSNFRVHVVLVLPPTRRHRAMVGALPLTMRSTFPVSSRDLNAALGGDGPGWPGDGILWIPGGASA
jgi:transcriptional regulator with XRE-family HTH domain